MTRWETNPFEQSERAARLACDTPSWSISAMRVVRLLSLALDMPEHFPSEADSSGSIRTHPT
ncbi:hypothetical protein TPA4_39 [Tsukamurella phage TPA4]|uniref:hypothetical protein n=1 Tax=Tsukamurella phage TPA4 TaxID=1647476 RepID=UPI0007B644E8|nr:hypothetical protein BH784_gp39 [Tsukamurella phage TPA4]AKJ72204.1 hypothetical protein TPA4_39 [Tsukamurella phage TPA4]